MNYGKNLILKLITIRTLYINASYEMGVTSFDPATFCVTNV